MASANAGLGAGITAVATVRPAGATPPRMLDLLTIGEPLVCLTSRGRLAAAPTLEKSIGGAEANVAIGLARLGRRTAYVSRVGSDPFGDEIVRTLRGEGVDVSRIERSTVRPTGLMVKELRSPYDARIHYYRQGSAATELDVVEGLPPARYVHASGITLAIGAGPASAVGHLLETARESAAGVSFDPNIRRKLWPLADAVAAVRAILPLVGDLLLSEAEARAIAGAQELEGALAWLRAQGIPRIVVRRGADGAIGLAGDRRVEVATLAPGPVVDSVGAGDAFTAGYLYERLAGTSFEMALTTGAWAAGHVVTHVGDYEGLPDRHDYAAWRGDTTAIDR